MVVRLLNMFQETSVSLQTCPNCLDIYLATYIFFYPINFSNMEVPDLVTVVRNTVYLVTERTPEVAPNY